jgi:uncharacterized protein YmfQ (DUF2313 family)
LTTSYPLDRHVRRNGDAYAGALLALLPKGQAWPKSDGTTLTLTIDGLAQYWGFVDSRAADLLERESDPRYTVELLPDWEAAWGLPDPCLSEPLTMGERRTMLLQRMTLLGSQSRPWFYEVAAQLGYTITIGEYAPFITGISRCGTTLDEIGKPRWEIGQPENRFYWKVYVQNARLTWFRTGVGVCGDHFLEIGLATDLECILGRWEPAHTKIIFDYSSLSTGGSMAGLP